MKTWILYIAGDKLKPLPTPRINEMKIYNINIEELIYQAKKKNK